MEFALVDGVRRTAAKGLRGRCPMCDADAVAKCGPRVIHHWAHHRTKDCDPWWENETEWHRAWKAQFPEAWREVGHMAADGEVHRADVKTAAGTVLEIQHSQITDAERSAREAFYGNLVWLVDGRGFRVRFDIYHPLPDPASALARDLVWLKATREHKGCGRGIFYRRSENPGVDHRYDAPGMVEIHGIGDIEEGVHSSYIGHHQYDWVRPHKTWLDAACPVFVDLGLEYLAKLCIYDDTALPCVRLVGKQRFVAELIGGARGTDIGA